MNTKRFIFLTLGGALVGIGSFLIIGGRYPIIRVNSSFITARSFGREYAAADAYSGAVLNTIGSVASSSVVQGVLDREKRAVVLDQLVEQKLVRSEVQKLLGESYEGLVAGKIKKYEKDSNLTNAAGKLFKLSYDDFQSLILVPLAERDLLSARLFIEGKAYEDWVAEARKSAAISVYSSTFQWEKGHIIPK